ncbi:MAG TPA: amidohydrolase family protein [Steroidobacteraceae bacterium]|nr:amidohydrolase family protein [Steroidobacteraceae bacterium]
MKNLHLILATAALACFGAAHAADAPVIALKAARLFDAVNGSLRTDAVVVVQGTKILSVGGEVPAGAQVIDLGNATLLPGFIDAHTHLTQEYNPDYYKEFYKELFRFPAEQSFYAAVYAKHTLEAGFTTVRNVGANDWVDVGLRNAINAGVTEGPHVLTAIHAIGVTGGHCDQSPFPPEWRKPVGPIEGVCDSADSCREAVRDQMKWGADVIKICASGGVLSESDPVDVPQLTPAELDAIVSEAHRWKRKVAAHCHGDVAARQAIEAGVDSIEHGTFLTEDTLKLMKKKGVYLVPTRMAAYWVGKNADVFPPQIAAKARAVGGAHAAMFKMALNVGVNIAFGTDAGVYPHGMNAMEFALMTDLGMAPSAALLSGTRDAARLLGVDSTTGTLEAGKTADIVAVPGNVLEDIHATEHPVFVMKDGQVYLRK